MRVLIVSLFIMLPLTLFSQTETSGILTLPENSHNFGRIMEAGGVVSHRFIFENSGESPLVINKVRTTCGCTTPKWTRNTVAPGEMGFVEVQFNPKGRKGSFHKTVQIQSTAKNSNMFLTIDGNVVQTLEQEKLKQNIGELKVKADHVNMGFLYKGTFGTEHLIIANPTDHSLNVEFKDVPEYIKLTVKPEVLEPGEYGQIEVKYYPDQLNDWDMILDKIKLILNNKVAKEQLVISANIREDFSKFTPEQLEVAPKVIFEQDIFRYDTITSDKSIECKFKIRNEGQSDLIIRAVKPSCGCTAVKPEKSVLAPGESTYINSEFFPKGRSGDIRNSITVITNDPKQHKKHLIMLGFIKR